MVTIESGKLGELFKIKQNKMPIKNNEMVVFLGMEDVSEDGKIVNQHVLPFSEIKKGLTYFEKNDILVAKITPCFENGKGAFLDTLKTEKGFGSTEFYVLRAKTNVDPRYIFYHTQTEKFRKKLESEMTGTAGQKRVPISAVINYPLSIVHSRTEQQAIASALSDVDALIIALEHLITKKRNIKQGAMQQLLTGKKRLPGFSGEWEVKTLEETTDCLDNLRVPLNDAHRLKMQGDYPYCGANGILDYVNSHVIDDDIILIAEDGGYFDEYSYRPIAYKMVGKCWVNNHAHILKAKEGFNQNFIFYSLVHKNILRFLASGTRAKLNKSEMYKIEIDIPEEKEEQEAIAQILSDMDAEIEALEQKRDKYRELKQGMMQELLTVKTRLVKED